MKIKQHYLLWVFAPFFLSIGLYHDLTTRIEYIPLSVFTITFSLVLFVMGAVYGFLNSVLTWGSHPFWMIFVQFSFWLLFVATFFIAFGSLTRNYLSFDLADHWGIEVFYLVIISQPCMVILTGFLVIREV